MTTNEQTTSVVVAYREPLFSSSFVPLSSPVCATNITHKQIEPSWHQLLPWRKVRHQQVSFFRFQSKSWIGNITRCACSHVENCGSSPGPVKPPSDYFTHESDRRTSSQPALSERTPLGDSGHHWISLSLFYGKAGVPGSTPF